MTVSKRQTEPDTERRERRMIYGGDMEARLISGFTHFIAGMKENMQNA